jgi:hypothetical protein
MIHSLLADTDTAGAVDNLKTAVVFVGVLIAVAIVFVGLRIGKR